MNKNLFQENEGLISIRIDDSDYTIGKTSLSGEDLRQLASLSMDAEIWQAIPGPSNDKYIAPDDVIALESGLQFYTAKKTISPIR